MLGPGTSGKELRAVSRAGMRSYGRYWMEVFRLPTISKERLLRDMQINTAADEALTDVANGKGVIFALPHMGNWEVAGAYVVARGLKFATVAERLKPESIYDMFLAFREGLGMEVLTLGGGVCSACWPSGCAPGTWCACSATATSPKAASRWTSSARRRGWPPGPPRSPCRPAPHCTR